VYLHLKITSQQEVIQLNYRIQTNNHFLRAYSQQFTQHLTLLLIFTYSLIEFFWKLKFDDSSGFYFLFAYYWWLIFLKKGGFNPLL
jgi:hypothetical protein